MIKWLICKIWGHKTVIKAYTGDTYDTIDRLTYQPLKGRYYKWEVQKFCVRCGKPRGVA